MNRDSYLRLFALDLVEWAATVAFAVGPRADIWIPMARLAKLEHASNRSGLPGLTARKPSCTLAKRTQRGVRSRGAPTEERLGRPAIDRLRKAQ
jgi:hypothetical protein